MTARLLALALLIALSGCSWIMAPYRWVAGPPAALSKIAIMVEPGANDDSPIALDVVYTSSLPPLPETIGKLDAADWFAKREQLQRDFPTDLQVISWEVVPGQVIASQDVPDARVGDFGFLFARYAAPGAHRFALGTSRRILVTLGAQDLKVTPQ